MDQAGARRAVEQSRVARLATTSSIGQVDLVPITYALIGDRVVTAVDHKPKTTRRLQRLENVRRHPEVTLLVDHYDDDWDRLWWVRVRGVATVVDAGDELAAAVQVLQAKYLQYEDRPPAGPAILVALTGWRWWQA